MVREGWCGWGGKVFVLVRIFLSPLLFQNKFICQTVNCQAVYEESFLPFQKWDLKRWPQWEKKSYHYALLVLMDWKEIKVYESFLYVIEAVPVLRWNTLPIEFQSNYSQGRQILCCCFIYFSWEFTQQIQICHHLFPVLMQYATRLERKYVISLTMVLC